MGCVLSHVLGYFRGPNDSPAAAWRKVLAAGLVLTWVPLSSFVTLYAIARCIMGDFSVRSTAAAVFYEVIMGIGLYVSVQRKCVTPFALALAIPLHLILPPFFYVGGCSLVDKGQPYPFLVLACSTIVIQLLVPNPDWLRWGSLVYVLITSNGMLVTETFKAKKGWCLEEYEGVPRNISFLVMGSSYTAMLLLAAYAAHGITALYRQKADHPAVLTYVPRCQGEVEEHLNAALNYIQTAYNVPAGHITEIKLLTQELAAGSPMKCPPPAIVHIPDDVQEDMCTCTTAFSLDDGDLDGRVEVAIPSYPCIPPPFEPVTGDRRATVEGEEHDGEGMKRGSEAGGKEEEATKEEEEEYDTGGVDLPKPFGKEYSKEISYEVIDDWRFMQPDLLKHVSVGGIVFCLSCRRGDELSDLEVKMVKSFVNLTSFKDEVSENHTIKVDFDRDEHRGMTYWMNTAVYHIPKVKSKDVDPALLSSYKYQKACQPSGTKVWEDVSEPDTFRITKKIIPFVFSVTIQFKCSLVPSEYLDSLSVLSNGLKVHKAILMERTKRHKSSLDMCKKCKALLLYHFLPGGGVIVTNPVLLVNTSIPRPIISIMHSMGSKGAKEVMQTAEQTRCHLSDILKDS
eukprot:Sspe_Gene.39135::Locus_18887_Transcript_1_1_Confidence_1.000_Length_2118::g.39135::m.39135